MNSIIEIKNPYLITKLLSYLFSKMARQRSITIYAENESEFENIISSTDLPQKKNKCIRDNTQYDTDDEDDLGSSSQYTIQRKSLSMEEQEKEEESKLIEKISKMNLKYKEGSIDDLTDEEENQTDDDEHHEQRHRSFIEQNVTSFDEIIKLIVIGQKKVGKTTFINKLTGSTEMNSPTQSLEIKKAIKQIDNRKVKIELWDTNENIINSSLITTFYKIAGGFIIIIDTHTDFAFIKKQIELINSITNSNAHFYIIFNTKNSNEIEDNSKLSELESHFLVETEVMDVNELSFERNFKLCSFIRSLLRSDKKYHSLSFIK